MPDALTNHISELEHSLLDPATRADSQRVAALLADDFLEFGSSGRVWTRDSVIEGLAAESSQPHDEPAVSDLTVKQLADTVALVTYRVSRSSDDRRTLRSSIWQREDDRWRMVFHQGTIVPAEVTV